MDAIRNTYSAVKRCRKAVWRSVKNNCLLSSFRRRQESTTKCSLENSFDGLMATAQEKLMFNENLSATTIDDSNEIKQMPAMEDSAKMENSAKMEEKDEFIHSDIQEGQSQNTIDVAGKKKRKRDNRRRRRIAKMSDVVVKDDQMKSFDLSPSSLVKETVAAETVSNVSLRVDHKETGISEIGEFGYKCNGDTDHHSQTETASATTMSWRVKNETHNRNNAIESLKIRKLSNGSTDQRSQTQPGITISSTGEGKSMRKVVHMYLSSNKNVKLDRTDNAWVPTIVARQSVTVANGTYAVVAMTNIESNTTEKINKSIRSILNKITPENADELIKSFMRLPINTIERMENAADLVFERAIQEQSFVALYAALCSAMQSVQVTCAQSNVMTSFKLIIINKCRSLFESDKSNHTSSVKKLEEINSCRDPEKKNELQFEYRENDRRLHKRSVGNCCFIGQLLNQRIINPKIIQYCIACLICQRSDDSIECLCNLLRTCGKELERSCNLNDTFGNLKALAYVKSLSLRIRFMVQATVEFRRNKWLSRSLDIENSKTFENKNSYSDSVKHPAAVVANVVLPKSDACKQTRPHLSSKKSNNSLKITERVELDPAQIDNKIHSLCSNIIKEYEELTNLDDVIYSLTEDEKSCIRTRHQQFVTSTLMITLDCSSKSRTEAGKMFAELLVRNALTTTEISRGIDTVLEKWNDYVMDYPNFFSYVAAIAAPLLTSKTANFDFYNLKFSCSSIRRSNNSSEFFAEVLKTIICSEGVQNVQNDRVDDFGSTLRAYNMWRKQTKYVPLDVFMPNNELNKFFKNDQLGVLLLSMAMFDITNKVDDNKSFYKTTHKWIRKNIDVQTVKLDDFVRSLTIATTIVCSNKSEDDSNGDFFDRDRGVLIKEYVRSVCDLSTTETRAREIQCVRGIQAISAALQDKRKSGEIESRLLHELCRVRAISSDSIDFREEIRRKKSLPKEIN